MDTPDDFIGPVNTGNPGEFTIRELAELIIDQTGSKSKLVHKPLPADDPMQRCPDITLAKAALGWESRIPLGEGLKKTNTLFRISIEENEDVKRALDRRVVNERRGKFGYRTIFVGNQVLPRYQS